jgi:hypothetical protein
VLYTDFTHAPLGAPLTVCGLNFGKSPLVMVGGVLAPVLQSAASLNPGYDCARVTIPAGGPVSVNGVAGPPFTIQPGDIPLCLADWQRLDGCRERPDEAVEDICRPARPKPRAHGARASPAM